MTTRRSFLRGLFAAPAVVVASNMMPISVKALALPPRLIGDGIADDTAALQYLLDQAARNFGTVRLPGVYRVTASLRLHGTGVQLIDTTIRVDHPDVALSIEDARDAAVIGARFELLSKERANFAFRTTDCKNVRLINVAAEVPDERPSLLLPECPRPVWRVKIPSL